MNQQQILGRYYEDSRLAAWAAGPSCGYLAVAASLAVIDGQNVRPTDDTSSLGPDIVRVVLEPHETTLMVEGSDPLGRRASAKARVSPQKTIWVKGETLSGHKYALEYTSGGSWIFCGGRDMEGSEQFWPAWARTLVRAGVLTAHTTEGDRLGEILRVAATHPI